MCRTSRRGWRSGLGLVELLVVLAVMAVLAMLILPQLARTARPAHKVKCVSNLKNVGLAFRIFATDNNDLFPPALMISNGLDMMKIDAVSVLRSLSNELSTPKILHCWQDADREEARAGVNFDTMTAKNVSYLVSLSANETNPAGILAGDRNLMTDGKVLGPGVFALTTNMTIGWTKKIHNGMGNVAMADGSVQQSGNGSEGTTRSDRLQQMVRDQKMMTNWLAVP